METLKRRADNAVLSSSPAFGTPLHPILPTQAQRPIPQPAFKPSIPTILPILLPPPTLRPLAFRTFTKKHNLTLNSSALQALATFIGRHCGSGWREDGTGEKVLEEVAKLWKVQAGPVIVEDGEKLKAILKTLEGCMVGGRIGVVKTPTNLSRQSSFAFGPDSAIDTSLSPTDAAFHRPSLDSRHSSFGMSKLDVAEDEDEQQDSSTDARAWLRVVSAFDQPRFSYDIDKKHFNALQSKPSPFPSSSHKTALFKERYNIIYQRLLRNEAFQTPSFSARPHSTSLSRKNNSADPKFYQITPIANLLGRGGSSHLLLALLVIAPTGTLALNDPTGSISLDLQHAHPLQGEDSCFFCPGMIVLVDGVYEEDWAGAGSSGLGNTGGVGGTIGGRFIGFSIGGPPVEKRNISLGINLGAGDVGGGFGWTDFLGQGSERAVGVRMRKIEKRLLSSDDMNPNSARRKMVVLGEVNLDQPQTLLAFRKVLQQYHSMEEPPMAFLLLGNFTSHAAMAGSTPGSIEYKEFFNELAAILSDFPTLLRNSTWIFVPGDNDPWSSAFSAGASTLIPREGVPEVFTSRLKRAFASAKAEVGARKDGVDGEAIWTSNPTCLSLFGPAHEIAIFRDDISGRFRRNAVRVGQAAKNDATAQPQQNSDNAQPDEDILMSGALPTETTNIDTPDADSQTQDVMPLDDPRPATSPLEPEDDYNTAQAKKLILSLLPQSTLSPFSLTTRPVHWDYHTSALSLYPLPHTLILADAEAKPFTMTFEGCHVLNPGRFVVESGRRGRGWAQWVEYDLGSKRGMVRGDWVE